VAFRDVTPERMRRPLSVLVVNCRKIDHSLRGFECYRLWLLKNRLF
jgi:hypothetical protein